MKVRKTIIAAALVVSGFAGLVQSAQAQQVAALSSYNGHIVYTNRVEASRSEYYLVRATGGVPLYIELRGDGLGTPDLDLVVEDDNGYKILTREGPTDQEQASFTPARAGVFKITVKNLDRAYNDYRLVVQQRQPNIMREAGANIITTGVTR